MEEGQRFGCDAQGETWAGDEDEEVYAMLLGHGTPAGARGGQVDEQFRAVVPLRGWVDGPRAGEGGGLEGGKGPFWGHSQVLDARKLLIRLVFYYLILSKSHATVGSVAIMRHKTSSLFSSWSIPATGRYQKWPCFN